MNDETFIWNNGEGDAAQSVAIAIPRAGRWLPHVEPHEIEEARRITNESFKVASKGKDLKFRPAGHKLLVKIHIRPEELKEIVNPTTGEKHTLYLPDTVRAEDKFHSCCGLVLDMGPTAYTGTLRDGSPRFPSGPWATVGSWVVFDRYGGKRVTINGVACMILNDDAIDGVIDGPEDIEAGHSEHRI